MKDTSDNTFHIKREWELELNTIIDDDAWEDICQVINGLEVKCGKNLIGR